MERFLIPVSFASREDCERAVNVLRGVYDLSFRVQETPDFPRYRISVGRDRGGFPKSREREMTDVVRCLWHAVPR